jgi:hypothetical protein
VLATFNWVFFVKVEVSKPISFSQIFVTHEWIIHLILSVVRLHLDNEPFYCLPQIFYSVYNFGRYEIFH